MKNLRPKVSICIPTYRQVDFLRLTLESVITQRFNDYEVIITDDSPDESVINLLLEFNFEHRLRYFKNSIPLGSPKNWNEAVAKANGDLIKVLHHDDKFSHCDALQAFVKLMDESPHADFGFCNTKVLDINTGKCRIHSPSTDQLQMLRSTPELLFLGNAIGAPSATIYKRNIMSVEYDPRLKWLVDIDFYIRVLQINNHFAYTKDALVETPTNARHQVTEICKSNAELEFWEYSILYLKHAAKLINYPAAMNQFYALFGRYGNYSTDKIPNFNKFDFEQKKLIEEVLAKFKKRLILRGVYFLYWQLKAPPYFKSLIRALIHILFNMFSFTRNLLNRLKKIKKP